MNMLLAAAFYFALVAGGLLPFTETEPIYLAAKSISLAGFLAVVFSVVKRRSFAVPMLAFLGIAVPLLLWSALRSSDVTYALQKVDAIAFGTVGAAAFFYRLRERAGMANAFDRLLWVALAVLTATIGYKLAFGFWDRSVRFFLNGPIVFGWLMGSMCLIALNRLIATGASRYFLAAMVFFSATVWTMSKGAIVALLASAAMLAVLNLRHRAFGRIALMLAPLLLLAALLFSSGSALPLNDTRLAAFSRILTNEIDKSDEGSIVTRLDMLDQSADLIRKHYALGVGLANWQTASGSQFEYPHNVYAELAAEFGLPIAMMLLLTLATMIGRVPNETRVIALFFLIASGFSGDASYLRFPLAFILASWPLHRSAHETPAARHWARNQGHRHPGEAGVSYPGRARHG